jgi:hypothetical protein
MQCAALEIGLLGNNVMKSVAKIKWISDDGIEFESYEACFAHERRGKFKQGLSKFFQKIYKVSAQDAATMISPDDDDVWALILDNAEDFQEVMKLALLKARGRKRLKPRIDQDTR